MKLTATTKPVYTFKVNCGHKISQIYTITVTVCFFFVLLCDAYRERGLSFDQIT